MTSINFCSTDTNAAHLTVNRSAALFEPLTYAYQPYVFASQTLDVEPLEKILHDTHERLKSLAERYERGELELADVVRSMGPSWTLADVLWHFDQLHVGRLTNVHLNEADRQKVLAQLARIQQQGAHPYHTQEWIAREVIASQRIEGIQVLPGDLNMH